MKIQRTIPPSAAPVDGKSIVTGLAGIFSPQQYLEKREDELRAYFGAKHVFLVSSGKAALTLILNALQSLSPGKRKVLIPAYTCFSVPSAIVKAGLEVSLCDVDGKTFDFDYGSLAKEVNEDTLCLVPRHLFGIPSDLDRIRELNNNHKWYVVEDAAQAMGGTYKGRKLGTIGDVGFFSLGRGKNITCGSGGIIVTNSDVIAHAINREYAALERPRIAESVLEFLKAIVLAIFIHPSLFWLPSGLPFLRLGETIFYKDFPVKRFSGMKAGLLRDWKERLEQSNRCRRDNAQYFMKMLGMKSACDYTPPFLRLPFMVENRQIRDSIHSRAQEKGMGISFLYPTSVNRIEEIKDLFRNRAFPCASDIANRILTVPTHELLTEKDKRNIIKFLGGAVPCATYERTCVHPAADIRSSI